MTASRIGSVGKWIGMGGGTLAVVLVLLWLMGVFHEKVQPAPTHDVFPTLPEGAAVQTVQDMEVPIYETSIGSISPVQRIQIGSKLLARVVTMKVEKAGQKVKEGELLVRLQSQDLEAMMLEAKAAHASAEAELGQARSDLDRVKNLFQQKVASQEQLDKETTRLRTAEAAVQRAAQSKRAAETTLSFATITSPITGIVVDKKVEQGDIVVPGQVLMSLYDPGRMQLVARVRESLAARLVPGQSVDVRVDALDLDCSGKVDQIVPEAEENSHVFEVKISGPCPPGIYSGMFGRIQIPVGKRREVHLPETALKHVGQIEWVYVVLEGNKVLRRFVQTGRWREGQVEILSGLEVGERYLIDAEVMEN
jgi:RND family efflux transporter MFP subunit